MTAELTNNGKAVEVKTNDLNNIANFDWESAVIPLVNIGRTELQTNNQGIVVYLTTGEEYIFNISHISRINNILTITNDVNSTIIDNTTLKEHLDVMLGYKTA